MLQSRPAAHSVHVVIMGTLKGAPSPALEKPSFRGRKSRTQKGPQLCGFRARPEGGTESGKGLVRALLEGSYLFVHSFIQQVRINLWLYVWLCSRGCGIPSSPREGSPEAGPVEPSQEGQMRGKTRQQRHRSAPTGGSRERRRSGQVRGHTRHHEEEKEAGCPSPPIFSRREEGWVRKPRSLGVGHLYIEAEHLEAMVGDFHQDSPESLRQLLTFLF